MEGWAEELEQIRSKGTAITGVELHRHAELVAKHLDDLLSSNKEVPELRKRVAVLEQAIRDHRSQKADDRCIEDDDRLYEALGDGVPCDRRVGDKDAMLDNCRRFIERRCEGGGWPSYAELAEENERLAQRYGEQEARIETYGRELSELRASHARLLRSVSLDGFE